MSDSMNSSNPQTRKPVRRADAPEAHCLSNDLKRLRGMQRELLRAGGDKQQKLQADLAALIERSRTAVLERRAKLPKPEFQADLPVNEKRADIAELIANNQVVIVCGETGSGKTTQLPKICLDLGIGARGLIGHTQPRRLAARSVATRLAQELKTQVGAGVALDDVDWLIPHQANIRIMQATAKRLGVRKTVADVENLDYVSMAESLDIGTIINKKAIAASRIYQVMLDADVLNVTFLMSANADVAEFVAKEDSKVT